MGKKLAVLALMAALALSTIGVSACDNGEDVGQGGSSVSVDRPSDSGSLGDSSFDSPDVPSISLNTNTMTLSAYETDVLTATLDNSAEAIVWSSSNDEIATVIDGKVVAFSAGTVTITATAGEISASCEVTVAASDAPIFSEIGEGDKLSIVKTKKKTLDTEMTLNGEKFSDVTYTFTVENGEDEAIISVSEDGEITALDYGTQTVTVKAYFYGKEIASVTLEITVIEYGMLITDLAENKLSLVLGDEGYSLSEIQVQINGVAVENPTFTAVSDNEEIVIIEEGKIVAHDRGETTVTVSYTSENGNTYQTVLTVTVTKQVIETDVDFLVKGSNTDLSKANTGAAVIELPGSVDITSLSQVFCGEQEVAFSKDGNTLTLTDAPAGEQVYTLVTLTKDYIIEGCIYNNTVSTKNEFIAWRENAGNIYAYTILTADIDLDGTVFETATYAWLRSWLDGRGHTISNFTVKSSLVQNLHATGGFRNLQFVNIVQDCTGVTNAMKFGFLAQIAQGTFENILIVGSLKGIGVDVAHWGTLCYGGSETLTVKNVVVQLNSVSEGVHYIVGPNITAEAAAKVVIDNVHFIFDGPKADISSIADTNSAIYANDEALAKADFSKFSDKWTAEPGKVPYMSDYSTALNSATVTVSGESNLGYSLTFDTTSFYPLTYALAEEYTGITVEGNTVVIGENAIIGSEFKVLVSCEAVDGFSTEFTFTVKKPIVNTGLTLLAKGDAAITEENANTGNAVVNMSESGIDLSKVTEIRCNGVTLDGTAYSIGENQVTFVNAAAGENVYTFVSTTAEYTLNICIYNYAISTKAEFLSWRDTNVWKYAILTADIDLENQVLAAAAAGAMRGILDGRGHKISNFTVSTGLVKTIQAAGGFKNIQFINVTQDCTGIETTQPTYKAVRYGFLTQTLSGTIENVSIQGKIINIAEGASHWGVLCYNSQASAVIKNVVLDIVSDGMAKHYVINTSAATVIDNVHFNFRASNEEFSATVLVTDFAATNVGVYTTDENLAAADFSLFTGIWVVEKGKLPYMVADVQNTTEE